MRESFRHVEQNKKVDLIGLGNAIVDIIVNIEDEFLKINNLEKGSMNLINSDESQKLLKNCKVIKQISGGSSANTVVCLAELGNNVQFIGRVKNDQFGNFFSSDIKKSKTIFNTPPTIEGASTAHSIILITPDAQRTMCTYLGASIEFEPEDIDFSVLKESKYLYLEGYLWDSELAKNAFLKAAQIAKQSNTKIILSLSDSFCVDRHRKSFLELIDNYVDIVFCNESEVLRLFKKDKLANCQGDLSSLCELVVVTLGSNGSLIINKNDIEEIKIKLLCYPRILGYVFNPLSVFYVYDKKNNLISILYEVKNTFGEQHTYIFKTNDNKIIKNNCSKKFYVSPFIEMDCEYNFRVLNPSNTISVIIDQKDKNGKLLYASQDGIAQELNEKNLLFTYISHPLMTFKIIAAIHYEALKLWIKGIKLVKKNFKNKNNTSIEKK